MIIKPNYLAEGVVGTNNLVDSHSVDLSRRRFVQGVVAGSTLVASGLVAAGSAANEPTKNSPVLSGNYFKLSYDYQKVNFTGRDRIATAIVSRQPHVDQIA